MGTQMEKYLKALSGQHGMVPAHSLRENVRTMRGLEETFRKDLHGMLVALGRRDMSLVENAITKMESTITEAKSLVEKVRCEAEGVKKDDVDSKDKEDEEEKESDE
jgi:hypothetical protein